jgi:adenylate cyclase class 2
MLVETEVKLRVEGLDAARRSLAGIGATPLRARHLEDNVLLDDESGSLRRAGCLLRIRRSPHGTLLTFKGPRLDDPTVKSREEIESGAADAEALREIFRRLGFRPVFRYQKYRETYTWNDVMIMLDETPIGAFLEIEGRKQDIEAAAAALGRGPEDFVTTSYAGLFFAAGGRGDMMFPGSA